MKISHDTIMFMTMRLKSTLLSASMPVMTALLVASCGGRQGWSVEGTVDGGAGQKIALQGFNNDRWYTIDSLSISDNGSFGYTSAAPAAYPEVLRLSLGDECIYFPVDSVDEIVVTANAASLTSGYRIAGSRSAALFMETDSLIRATIMSKGETDALTDSLLKRRLTEIVLADDDMITAYYIINKQISGHPLFDLSRRSDRAVIGAVAQGFASKRPDDPRTQTLRDIFIRAKLASDPESATQATIEVPETGLAADITAYDNRGTKHSLHEVASKGNVVLLSFTRYDLESSPAYNVILADLYKKYHDRGLEIFQIAFDPDEAEWKQSAVNMPWIAVWNSQSDGADNLVNYNVGALPMTFVIDRNGDLRSRIADPTKLEAEVTKFI